MLIPIAFALSANSGGYIGGTSPDGLVTVAGTPGRAELVLLNRTTLALLATTLSQHVSGEYRFHGLTLGTEYTVIARDPTRTYKDMIEGAVTPIAY